MWTNLLLQFTIPAFQSSHFSFASGIFTALLAGAVVPILFKSAKKQENILQQIALISQAIEEIANGKFNTRIPQLQGNDFVQDLAENINQMAVKFENQITDLNNQKAAQKLQDLTVEQARLLQEIENRQHVLDEAAIVSEVDRKGNITFVNDKFCEISGYS
ncbi:hypothetical protein H6S82_04265, partial [Planktothrix sp. FACHB-1355]